MLHESDALAKLGYFFLGSGKLYPDFIRKTHQRSVLACSKSSGPGQGFFFPREKQNIGK
jgi:hypothetical protein